MRGHAENGEEQLGESVLEQFDKLNTKELEEYLESLGFEKGTLKARIKEYLSGKSVDYGSFFGGLSDLLFSDVKSLLPTFATMLSATVLCAVMQQIKSGFLSKSTTEILFFACYAAVLVPTLAILVECLTRASGTVKTLSKQMQILFPILITLITACGGNVSVGIFKPSVAFLSTTIVSLVSKVVFPLTVATIAFSVVGNLSGGLKIGKFGKFFKSVNKWLIGVSIAVFGAFFTVQGLTGGSIDGAVRGVAKYAIGQGVPIVGGFLSSGFDLAVAGSLLIKNSLGVFGIFLMLSTVAEPLIFLVSASLLFRLTSAVCEPLGDSRISDFLSDTADNLSYFTAGILFVGFLYFITVVLFVCSMGTGGLF